MKEIVPSALAGERVDRVVAMLTGLPRAEVNDLVERGAVVLRGKVVTSKSQKVLLGDEVEVEMPDVVDPNAGPVAEPDVDVPLIHVDEHVIVVDKPAELVVHPGAGNAGATMIAGLLARFPEIASVGEPLRPGVVHRLDKGTSGLLVVARTQQAYDSLVEQLSSRSVERRYSALVWGAPKQGAGVIDAPIGRSRRDPTRMTVSAAGREARTGYEVVQRYSMPVEVTRLECKLETGRTHQIRVHLAAIGLPIVGDPRYRGLRTAFKVGRPFLHAHRLAFVHPATGEEVAFEAPLPPELDAVLARLS